ncbi:hypothetical protein [Armatimonas sp.]|uniref:hypothetical protein n=1 Tax=Armatimonas sp. TaxID=1872638 RepID=UPI0037517A50
MPRSTHANQEVVPLAQLLPNLRWSPERQGIFLSISPESRGVLATKELPPPDGWWPEELARRSQGALKRIGRVTVLVPSTMRVWQRTLPRSDRDDETGEQTALLQLLASCNPAQWRMLASPQGLRSRDLNTKQQAFFEALIPRPFRFRVRDPKTFKIGMPVTLTDVQRDEVGLRVKLIGGVEGKKLNEKNGVFSIVFHRRVNNEPERILIPTVLVDSPPVKSALDESVTREVPNTLKPLPGGLGALRQVISLEASESLTIDELVVRIAQATRLPLQVEVRLKNHKIFIRGAQASAGELLQALCLGATATVRDLGGVLLLVPDTIPLDTGRVPLEEALLERRKQSSQDDAKPNQRITALKPMDYLTFDAHDPAALSPALLKKALGAHKSTRSEMGAEVSLTELPSPLQGRITSAIDEMARLSDTPGYQQAGLDIKMDSQSVLVGCHPWWSLVIPGVGEANENPLVPIHNWVADLPAPPMSFEGRALLARASTLTEARDLAQAAKSAGALALWLEAPPEVLMVAAELRLLPVLGVVSVLRGAPGKPDLNVLGETSAQYAHRRLGVIEPPWLDLQDRDTVENAHRRLLALARVAGLAGMVLRDILPPGYGMVAQPERGRYVYGAAGDLGYSKENRLAFLKAKGVDPADILSESLYLEGEELNPLVKQDSALGESWQQWRTQRAEAFAVSLRQELRRVAPKLPTFLERAALWQNDGWLYQSCPWFLSWPAEKPLPKVERRALGGSAVKRLGWRLLGLNPDENQVLRASTGQPEGEAVDFSAHSVAEIVKKLTEKP